MIKTTGKACYIGMRASVSDIQCISPLCFGSVAYRWVPMYTDLPPAHPPGRPDLLQLSLPGETLPPSLHIATLNTLEVLPNCEVM